MEKQVASHKKTIEENEAAISKLQSDLQKLSELRSKEKEDHEVELAATRESVKNAEEYCAGRFASFSEMLSSKMSSFRCVSDLLLSLPVGLIFTQLLFAQFTPLILKRSKLIWPNLPSL